MDSLNIDFRDNCLRIIRVKNTAVLYSGLIDNFSIAGADAKERFIRKVKESGRAKGKINIILPSTVLNHFIHQSPASSFEDAKKIADRRITKELQAGKFTSGIKFLNKDKDFKSGLSEILTQYALDTDIKQYLDFLKQCRLKPATVTTGIEGNIHAFNRIRPETDSNEAVIDLGSDSLEVAVINNGKMINYEVLPMPSVHDEGAEGRETAPGQISKMRLYKTIDLLYSYLMSSTKGAPEKNISKLWICGLGSKVDGISDSISDGLGAKAEVLAPPGMSAEGPGIFSALFGLSLISKSEDYINLLPRELLGRKKVLAGKFIVALLLASYLTILAGGYLFLKNIQHDLGNFLNERRAFIQDFKTERESESDIFSSGKDTFINLIADSPGLYPIFRDIANLTPKGVVLEEIQIKKTDEITGIDLLAHIKYRDESFKEALLSRFLSSLESSPRLRKASIPALSTSKIIDKEKVISVKITYEVVK